jgi:hypothetical protein
MITKSLLMEWWRRALVGVSLFALLSNNFYAFGQAPRIEANRDKATHIKTETPIKHVIVLIGENRTFDHLFATYTPKRGETISNLLSKGIINADGSPGRNFALAQQFQAVAPFRADYFVSLNNDEKAQYDVLPQPTLNFAPTKTTFPPGTPTSLLVAVEPSLETQDLNLLTTGAATGFSQTFVQPDPDTRVANSTTCQTDRSHCADLSCLTILTLAIPPIGCSRCGSNPIAMYSMPRRKIHLDA